jgi:hypothetical protein
MLYYLPENFDVNEFQDSKTFLAIKLASGGFVTAEAIDHQHVRIWSINSTDPMDYLNDRYKPGQVLKVGLTDQFNFNKDHSEGYLE